MNAISNCSYIDTGIPSPAIASLEVIDARHRLVAVRWASGKRRGRADRVDLSPLIDAYRFYAPLRKDADLFGTAHLIDDGYAIAWADGDIDMSATSVERLAEEAMTGADFRAFLNRHSLTHQAAASALGRSKRQIEHYLQDDQLPRMMALACIGYEARRTDAARSRVNWNPLCNNLSVKYEYSYTWDHIFDVSSVTVEASFSSADQPKKRRVRALSR
jgi:hypothetical protein